MERNWADLEQAENLRPQTESPVLFQSLLDHHVELKSMRKLEIPAGDVLMDFGFQQST